MLSTVTRLNANVLRIWLAGMEEPVELTGLHRLYSEDRQDWVSAGELVVGEKLRTVSGPLEIQRIGSRPGVHRVYNLEVETEHGYYVSTAGVLSHNTNPCGVNRTKSVSLLSRTFNATQKKVKDAIHAIKSGNRAGSGGAGRRNPDLEIDLDTGDAFIEGTDEMIDNLLDHL